jgi:high-affinity Fe2+/Pb2+ permease
MKIFLDFLGVLICITFNVLFGYGITVTLIEMNAPKYLLIIVVILYFISAILFSILNLYASYLKRKGVSRDKERNFIHLKMLSLVAFFVPFLCAMIFSMINQHAPIILVVFIIMTFAGLIPILKKQIYKEYNYGEARVKAIRWGIISVVTFIAFLFLTKIMSIPIDKWTL